MKRRLMPGAFASRVPLLAAPALLSRKMQRSNCISLLPKAMATAIWPLSSRFFSNKVRAKRKMPRELPL